MYFEKRRVSKNLAVYAPGPEYTNKSIYLSIYLSSCLFISLFLFSWQPCRWANFFIFLLMNEYYFAIGRKCENDYSVDTCYHICGHIYLTALFLVANAPFYNAQPGWLSGERVGLMTWWL